MTALAMTGSRVTLRSMATDDENQPPAYSMTEALLVGVCTDARTSLTSGRTASSPGVCTDIWVGADSHKLATDLQQKKHPAKKK